MGSWNETCGFSNLPISYDDDILFMVIKRVKREDERVLFYPFDTWSPVSVLIRGKYDDYGGVACDEAEAKRLFDSLEACGVFPKEVDMHGNLTINGVETLLPNETYGWMMRADCFEWLPAMFGRDDESTVGEMVESLRKQFNEKLTKHLNEMILMGVSFTGYDLERLFSSMEMPRPPITRVLLQDFQDACRKETGGVDLEAFANMLDEIEEGGDDPRNQERELDPEARARLTTVVEPLFDLHRVFIGMLILRKMLHPTGGAGSQAWNDSAYMQFAKFLGNTASDHRRQWDTEWDDDDAAGPEAGDNT